MVLSLKNDMFLGLFSYNDLIKMILGIDRSMERAIEHRPDLAFNPIFRKTAKGNKFLASVDLNAEFTMRDILMNKLGKDKVFVIGEESFSEKIDLSKETNKIIALMDMIDGTDLLERGFSNWCSAITFYQVNNNKEVKILGAFIAIRGDYIYYATADRNGAYKRLLSETLGDQEFSLAGPSKSRELKDASICMYAQKSKNLLQLLRLNNKKKFVHWLNEIGDIEKKNRDIGNSESIKFRFYNFAGNPMMAKLGDGIVDIVFDLEGQAPHDVVAGAFIAMKAKAVLGKISGEKFTLKELSDYLLHPSKLLIKYILAANESVLKEFSDLLSDLQ